MKISGYKTNSSTYLSAQIAACHVDDLEFRDYQDILKRFSKLTLNPQIVVYSDSICTSVCVRGVKRKCL